HRLRIPAELELHDFSRYRLPPSDGGDGVALHHDRRHRDAARARAPAAGTGAVGPGPGLRNEHRPGDRRSTVRLWRYHVLLLLAAARRVGPSGSVLATDISPAILEFAASEAKRAGLSNVSTLEMDGEQLEVEPDAYDAVISRLGLIFFPDQQGALKGIRRALR